MKKLSLIIALALIVSIGGVYATWSYAGASAAGNHKHMSVNLAAATTSVADGVITEVVNGMDVKIDDTNGDYNADLVITGKMAFVFTPNAGASAEVVANGIPMQWVLEQTDPGIQHNGVNVFTITQPTPIDLGNGTKITDSNKTTLVPGETLPVGGFYVEITGTDISAYLSTTLKLPTYAEYLTFQSEMFGSSGKLGITVSKQPATP